MLTHRTMKIIRRIHLYSGIILFLPVLLYGVTGFLFNHPTFFRGGETIEYEADQLRDKGFELPGRKNELATQLLASIKKKNADIEISLVEDSVQLSPKFSISGTLPNKSWTLTADESQQGVLRHEERNNDDQKTLNSPKRSPFEEWRQRTAASGEEMSGDLFELQPEKIRLRGPRLSMRVRAGDDEYEVRHDIGRNRTALDKVDETPMQLRSFLLRLHKSHAYPSSKTARWFWAVLVDVMSIAMIFWALSGLLMWTQLKRQRIVGTTAIVLSLVALAALVTGMHAMIRS